MQGPRRLTAYALTGSQHAAEDLLQAALAKLALQWRRVSPRLLHTRNGFAVTRSTGGATRRIPFPREIQGMPIESDSVNYVLSRQT